MGELTSMEELRPDIADILQRELLRLATREEQAAATETAGVPYWSPCPESVSGHRRAAEVLRAEANELRCNESSIGAQLRARRQ